MTTPKEMEPEALEQCKGQIQKLLSDAITLCADYTIYPEGRHLKDDLDKAMHLTHTMFTRLAERKVVR